MAVAAPDAHAAGPSANVRCLYCKAIVSRVLARLGSVSCHSCRSARAA
jgi:hypothetical protein